MLDESIIKDNYTDASDYLLVKGISLSDELRGSDDDPANAADRFIFRVERKVIAYLTRNYAFTESMITDDNQDEFVIAICDQIEEELANGANAPICEGCKDKLFKLGLMNIVRC